MPGQTTKYSIKRCLRVYRTPCWKSVRILRIWEDASEVCLSFIPAWSKTSSSARPCNLGNQKLDYHPHLHCIVPGGGVSPDGENWIVGNSKYLVPVKKLSAVFRGKLLSSLRKSCDRDELFGNSASYKKALYGAARKPFVVYAKKPFGSPAQVIKYLGRYAHRVGISEQRIVSIDEKNVCFTWLHRAGGHKRKKMTLTHAEFIDQFLMHLLPRGMRKIRYFGYMSNRNRQQSIDQVRQLIVKNPESCSNDQGEIVKAGSDMNEDTDSNNFEKNIYCQCVT